MNTRFAAIGDIPAINLLAHKIWRTTYRDILSEQQISFMLNEMYSLDALSTQLKDDSISFIIAENEDHAVAFASYSFSEGFTVGKIHKLYILPSQQGKGIGKAMVDFIEAQAKIKGAEVLELNVNRNNPAIDFYKKIGFKISEEVNIPYYDFVLNDYVMRRHINS